MRDLLILLLIAAVAYLAYDDFYVQRPALQRAQAGVQRSSTRVPGSPASPAWFQKHLKEGSGRLDAPTPMPQP